MNTKLTLNIDDNTIVEAKKYAKKSGTSVSKLVENYLNSLTNKTKKKKGEIEITPLVKSLTGIIPVEAADNYKKIIQEHLTEKYIK